MQIHEFQAKQILLKHGVPIPKGEVAFSVEEASLIADRIGTKKTYVVNICCFSIYVFYKQEF